MNTRQISIVIFYDLEGNIYVQERGSHSKVGERLGFFGGGIEKGEAPSDALLRELKEELNFAPESFEFWFKNNFIVMGKGKYEGWKIIAHIFLSKVDSGFEKSKTLEGSAVVKLKIDDIKPHTGFHSEDYKILRKFKSALSQIRSIKN